MISHASDARLLRRVRWRLVAWSGGLTFVVLVVLGTLIYLVVSQALESSNLAQLRLRADDVATQARTQPGRPQPLGPRFGNGQNNTFAFIVGPDGRQGPQDFDAPTGLPDQASVDAARLTGFDIRTITVDGVPVRILSEPVKAAGGAGGGGTGGGPGGGPGNGSGNGQSNGGGPPSIVQVVQDRSSELAALQLLAIVLVVGGILAVALSLVLGALYAGRALVPIRESLGRQREFAANASHELRTPLAIVRTSIEHLRRHGDERVSQVGTALDDMDAEVGRLTTLVDDLLLIARADSGAIEFLHEPLDLADVAAEAAGSANPLAQRAGVQLLMDLRPAPAIGDAGRLQQVATILIDNAIRHAPPGSTVRVSVASTPAGRILTVDDEGPGIRPEDLPHLFERFWRAPDAPEGGNGLGLSIAAWIVEHHDGTISATNLEPHGAEFAVRLPPA